MMISLLLLFESDNQVLLPFFFAPLLPFVIDHSLQLRHSHFDTEGAYRGSVPASSIPSATW